MCHPPSRRPIGEGFSLVEMAILLVILGFLAAALMPRIISGTKRDVTAEIKRAVRSARSEVLGYAKANGCSLPSPAWFQANAAHRLGRLGENLVYRQGGTITLVTNSSLPVAFWIASPGADRQPDAGNDYTAASISMVNVTDDIVDFATPTYVQGLCGP